MKVKALITSYIFIASTFSGAADFEIFKSPACGCCQKWIDAIENAGHNVTINNVDSQMLNQARIDAGLPAHLGACHTAFVDGYVIEGHVPLEAIDELLETKPNIKGIAVPGMPSESLGMEQGREPQPYVVQGFDKNGNVAPLSIYKGAEKVN